ncbi:hypothetical protein BJV82DRAFT_188390 [Fennellomyces sp. T-0311]|nr:hypothetical protein BJV82DRAFT_188390 [Fennellomyces sp. T-0311]
MSINGIFIIDGLACIHPSSRLEYGFDENIWDAMTEGCDEMYSIDPLPESTVAKISKLSKVIKKNFKECKSIVNSMDESEEYIKESLHNMLSLYSPKASKKIDQLESTFSLTAVNPMILPFLEETDLTTTKGTDGKTRKKDAEDVAKKGYQFSDLSINFEYGAMPQQALLIAEIKAPHKVRTGSRPDLVKLANQMKDAIDKMVDDSMDDKEITVLGLLIEGKPYTWNNIDRIIIVSP